MQGAWQVAGRRREQGTITRAKLRPSDLSTQNLQLVAQDQQLDVLDIQATATPNERAQQRPERDVEEREGHIADPPQTRPQEGATRVLAPFRPLRRRPHTHPWFTTPLFKSRVGGPVTWVGQHSRRAFAPIFRSVFSRSYRVTAAEIEQAYRAISRRDGVRVLPATAGYVDEHREQAARWDLARIAAELGEAVRLHVVGCSDDRFEARQLRLARERLGHALESTELPGGHLATAEQPRRLADLIEDLR
jgi:hypothetical protein